MPRRTIHGISTRSIDHAGNWNALAADQNLSCGCGRSDCPAPTTRVPNTAVVHVVADAAGVRDRWRGDARPAAGRGPRPRHIREIRHPGDGPPAPGYRPSAGLAEFVRCRDLTCRWPGCDRSAYESDLDHTVPYPAGPTHASNMNCYCRFHHLLITFWTGRGGWREQQLPDGTLTLTSPTGHAYTHPGSKLLFPTLYVPTGELPLPHRHRTPTATAAR
jgi:hypothetical protein